jgi:hypothetical protein
MRRKKLAFLLIFLGLPTILVVLVLAWQTGQNQWLRIVRDNPMGILRIPGIGQLVAKQYGGEEAFITRSQELQKIGAKAIPEIDLVETIKGVSGETSDVVGTLIEDSSSIGKSIVTAVGILGIPGGAIILTLLQITGRIDVRTWPNTIIGSGGLLILGVLAVGWLLWIVVQNMGGFRSLVTSQGSTIAAPIVAILAFIACIGMAWSRIENSLGIIIGALGILYGGNILRVAGVTSAGIATGRVAAQSMAAAQMTQGKDIGGILAYYILTAPGVRLGTMLPLTTILILASIALLVMGVYILSQRAS